MILSVLASAFLMLSEPPAGCVSAAVSGLERHAATAKAALMDGFLKPADTESIAKWHAVDVPVYYDVRALGGTYEGWRRLLGQTLWLLGYDGFVKRGIDSMPAEFHRAMADAQDDVAMLQALKDAAAALMSETDYFRRLEGRRAAWWMDHLDIVTANPDRVRAEAAAWLQRFGVKAPVPVASRGKAKKPVAGKEKLPETALGVVTANVVNQLEKFDVKDLRDGLRVTAGFGPGGVTACVLGEGEAAKIDDAPVAELDVVFRAADGSVPVAFNVRFGKIEPTYRPQPQTGYGYAAFDHRFLEVGSPRIRPLVADAAFDIGCRFRPGMRWLRREGGWTAEFRFPWDAFGGELPMTVSIGGKAFRLSWQTKSAAQVAMQKAPPTSEPPRGAKEPSPADRWKDRVHQALHFSNAGFRSPTRGASTEPFDYATEQAFYETCVKPIAAEDPSVARLERLRAEFIAARLRKGGRR